MAKTLTHYVATIRGTGKFGMNGLSHPVVAPTAEMALEAAKAYFAADLAKSRVHSPEQSDNLLATLDDITLYEAGHRYKSVADALAKGVKKEFISSK
jgi:hypothetical protein